MARKNCKRKVLAAVDYARKSTNEEKAEKSIKDQLARIRELRPPDDQTTYKVLRTYTRDLGVPGWQRGSKRPDYHKLVQDLEERRDVQVIRVDDMDRFSRADEWSVVADVRHLKTLGVRYIHSVNQGIFDLDVEGTIFMVAAQAMASHAHSTRLSRRIANARLDQAKKGLRSGGVAPYGYRMAYADGNPVQPGDARGKGKPIGCKLIPGDPGQVKVVKWIFDEFAKRHKSLNSIARSLNERGVPSRTGGRWYPCTIQDMLTERAYAGDFVYNRVKSGTFHIVNAEQKVEKVDGYPGDGDRKPWRKNGEGLIVVKNTHKALIGRKQFDAVQQKMKARARGSRKPRANGYPLSRILICGHCGKPMYGAQAAGRERVYRCSSNTRFGPGVGCNRYFVKEADILPFVLKLLAEEISILELAGPESPDVKLAQDRTAERKQRAADLQKKIDRRTGNLFDCEDPRTRKDLDRRITAMRDELAGLVAEPEPDASDDLEKLTEWWEGFQKLVKVPVGGDGWVKRYLEAFDVDGAASLHLDASVVNEALHQLGAEVRLRWSTRQVTLSNGKVQNRYTLLGGRFRLGQQAGRWNGKEVNSTDHRGVHNLTLPLSLLGKVDRTFKAADVIGGKAA